LIDIGLGLYTLLEKVVRLKTRLLKINNKRTTRTAPQKQPQAKWHRFGRQLVGDWFELIIATWRASAISREIIASIRRRVDLFSVRCNRPRQRSHYRRFADD